MHSDLVPIKNFECTPIWSLSEMNALPCSPYSYPECTPIILNRGINGRAHLQRTNQTRKDSDDELLKNIPEELRPNLYLTDFI